MVSKTKIIPGFTCQQGNITNTKMGKTYDVVLSLFHVLSYQITNKQLKDVFENASAHLKKDGLLFFESQATDVQNKFIKAVKFGPKVKVIEDRFIILERKKVKSDYPTNIPHREFLVCKKK